MVNEMAEAIAPEIVEARKTSTDLLARATELAKGITNMETLAKAADFLLEIKRRRKWWLEWNKPAKQKLDALKRELLDREREIDEPMDRAENMILKPAMSRFEIEQEQKRRAEEDRQREEQRKRAEDERIKAAAKLEQEGEKQAAQELIDAPIDVAPVVIPKAEAPTGISYRENWKYRITDASKLPREYLVPDDKAIGGVVRALKGETRIAGIEVYMEKTVAGRV